MYQVYLFLDIDRRAFSRLLIDDGLSFAVSRLSSSPVSLSLSQGNHIVTLTPRSGFGRTITKNILIGGDGTDSKKCYIQIRDTQVKAKNICFIGVVSLASSLTVVFAWMELMGGTHNTLMDSIFWILLGCFALFFLGYVFSPFFSDSSKYSVKAL